MVKRGWVGSRIPREPLITKFIVRHHLVSGIYLNKQNITKYKLANSVIFNYIKLNDIITSNIWRGNFGV